MSLFGSSTGGAGRLRGRLASDEILLVPGCFDALSARLIERAGFEAAFLGGFAVSATRLALPDAGLLSYGEIVEHGRNVCAAVSIPLFGDADTGYGNEVNIERTVRGYAAAGFAGLMIEDQAWPKRCGHTEGKTTVDRDQAVARVRAAVEARERAGLDILLIARTDAAATVDFDEALRRAEAFAELGAEITFVEAPRSEEEMRRYCSSVPGAKMANMVEEGRSPWLSGAELQDIGYSMAAYPLSMLAAAVDAMEAAVAALEDGARHEPRAAFDHLLEVVGFDDYRRREAHAGANSADDE